MAALSNPTPLPVSPVQVLGWFGGLYTQLRQVGRQQYPTAPDDCAAVTQLLSDQIRASQYQLEDITHVPYFDTRYCTQELAAQKGLVLGIDFDELTVPLDYEVSQWRAVSGRTEVNRMPINAIQSFRLTLGSGGAVADIPSDWWNVDPRHGQIHLMPSALTSLTATFFTMFAIHPMLLRPGMGNFTPLLVHVQYQAGLCRRTAADGVAAYDPGEFPKATVWQQTWLSNYQRALEKLAAAPLMRKVSPALNRGGVQVSVDGLSRSANTQSLTQLADQLEQEALQWANDQKTHSIGAGWVFA